jgi:hypothetical protein
MVMKVSTSMFFDKASKQLANSRQLGQNTRAVVYGQANHQAQ